MKEMNKFIYFTN